MGNKIQLQSERVNTLELHTAVDICALLVVSWRQRPNKRVVVLHRRPSHLTKSQQKHTYKHKHYLVTVYSFGFLTIKHNTTLCSCINQLFSLSDSDQWYLEETDPIIAGPGVLWAQGVVTINSALREVTATHVSKLHPARFFHGNTKQRQAIFHLWRKRIRKDCNNYCFTSRLILDRPDNDERDCLKMGERWPAGHW